VRIILIEQETLSIEKAERPHLYYGYVVTGVGLVIQAIAWGIFQTFGIFLKPILADFGWSRAIVSGVHSFSLLLHGLLSIIAGGLNDRFGPRIVLTICASILGLGFLLMSQVNSLWQLYLFYGVLVGIGVSATDVVPLSIIARWFIRKRSIMSGFVKVGTGLGGLVVPVLASRLIDIHGWRDSFLILGTLPLLSIIPISQLLERDPGKMGQQPDGHEQVTNINSQILEPGLSFPKAIRSRQFWVICSTYLVIIFCGTTITVHIVPHATDIGFSVTNAALILSTYGGVGMIGRVLMGYAGDKIGNKRALIISFLVAVPALVWLQFANELWMLYLFGAAYGFSHGGFFALISPTVAWLFGTRSQGVILGAVIFVGTIGGTIGPTLAGYTFDVTSSYQLFFLILVVFSSTGLLLAMFLRPISEGGGNETRRCT
jgi:MFS family permease